MKFITSQKYFILSAIFMMLVGCAQEKDFDPQLKNEQNALAYLNSQTAATPIISTLVQQQRYQNFLAHYYSPWTDDNHLFSHEQIQQYSDDAIRDLLADPGWAENKHRHQTHWANTMVHNMAMVSYPNYLAKAMTVRATDLRLFPTDEPSFSALDKPGSAYPFDNFQESYTPANLPVLILHTTQDKAWDLVLTNSAFGWIKASDLALVDETFMTTWQKNKGYIEFKNDQTSVVDSNGVFQFKSHMGAIYPIANSDETSYTVHIALRNAAGKAKSHKVMVAKDESYKIPLPATAENVATVANQFLGMAYGWGGLYGLRDCSSTTMNIMSYFGIWLPRNSAKQAEVGGKNINLKHLSNKEKMALIQKQGIPYMTLIHLPGHIMLYLGQKDNTIYALHDMWGLHTKHLFKSDGRAVVGSTVITPIDFGKGYINVDASLLDKVSDMVVLSAAPIQKP